MILGKWGGGGAEGSGRGGREVCQRQTELVRKGPGGNILRWWGRKLGVASEGGDGLRELELMDQKMSNERMDAIVVWLEVIVTSIC